MGIVYVYIEFFAVLRRMKLEDNMKIKPPEILRKKYNVMVQNKMITWIITGISSN